jgi:hypothetical protein
MNYKCRICILMVDADAMQDHILTKKGPGKFPDPF